MRWIIGVSIGALTMMTASTTAQTTRKKPAPASSIPSGTLPLKYGFYAEDTVACNEASSAVSAQYEGRTIRPIRGRSCKVQVTKTGGTTYRVQTACGQMGAPGYMDVDETISIVNATTFDLIVAPNRFRYRYCSPARP